MTLKWTSFNVESEDIELKNHMFSKFLMQHEQQIMFNKNKITLILIIMLWWMIFEKKWDLLNSIILLPSGWNFGDVHSIKSNSQSYGERGTETTWIINESHKDVHNCVEWLSNWRRVYYKKINLVIFCLKDALLSNMHLKMIRYSIIIKENLRSILLSPSPEFSSNQQE